MRLTLPWLTSMLVATACLIAQPAITPLPLDAILLRANMWELDQQALDAELTALHFEWISAARDVARSSAPGLVFRHFSLASRQT